MNREKLILILLLYFVNVFNLVGQTDSIAVVTARWNTKKIEKGVLWKQFSFSGNVFNTNQNINILEIANKGLISIGYDTISLKPTSEFGIKSGALAAINGTFFDMKNGGSIAYIKAGGQLINTNKMSENGRGFYQTSAVVISKRKLRIEKWNGSDDWESKLSAYEVMTSGPLLIFKNNFEHLDSSSFNTTRHPRTAVAVTSSRKVMLITIDGRNENASGMSLFELQRILRWLNVVDGINLNGGGSTTLWIKNESENGVVNYPSDNQKWDHFGERKVANVLLVKSKSR